MSRAFQPSGPKKFLFQLILVAVPLLAIEFGVRAFFAYQLGPSMLLYGTRFNSEKSGDAHSGDMNLLDGYFKYHPHEERYTRDKETGRLIRATINAHGFRGDEFDENKAPGVIRVVTLGASSTFGFSDRDDETYPYYLERYLNRDAPAGERFEVYNLGIPHLKSNEVRALFESEALPLHPDVVTYYQGINDSWSSPVLFKREGEVRSPSVVRETLRRSRYLHDAFDWLRDHFIVVNVADGFLTRERMLSFTAGDVDAHMKGKSEYFLANVSAIRDTCRSRGITFIAATQQAKSYLIDPEHIRGVTYEQECERVRRDLARRGHINRYELDLLTHARIMDELRKWAAANGVPLVDVIAATDQRRDCLVSWVHLSPEGNRMVARAFEDGILAQLHMTDANRIAHHRPVVSR
jgi:lysophospholipase L1-like esterase